MYTLVVSQEVPSQVCLFQVLLHSRAIYPMLLPALASFGLQKKKQNGKKEKESFVEVLVNKLETFCYLPVTSNHLYHATCDMIYYYVICNDDAHCC
jgi:hypothetical protein